MKNLCEGLYCMNDFFETTLVPPKKISYLTKKLELIKKEYSESDANDSEIDFNFREVVRSLGYMIYTIEKDYSGYGSLSPRYYVKHSFDVTDATHIIDLHKKRDEKYLDSYSKMMVADFIRAYDELKEAYFKLYCI